MAPTKHALLSPSAAHRWIACPPSARLTEHMPGSTSPYAEEGTKAHYLCEQTLRLNIPRWRMGQPDERAQVAEDDSPPEMGRAARAYAEFVHEVWAEFPSEPTIAVEQPVNVARWVPGCFGTCDCLLIGGGTLQVIDFKYGAGVPVSPVQNEQMMLYALGAYDLFSATDTINTVCMTIVQPRIQAEPERWTIATDELLKWAEDTLVPAAKLAWAGEGDFNPGKEQCRWCRAYPQCRAWQDKYGPLADFMAQPPEARDPRLLSNAEIGEWLVQAQDIADYVKALEVYTHQQLLEGNPVPGWKLVEGRSVRQFTDTDAAFTAMQQAGVDPAMLYERKPISLSAAEKLLGKKHFNEVCGGCVVKPQGKPTLAPESDNRPAYDPTDGFEAAEK